MTHYEKLQKEVDATENKCALLMGIGLDDILRNGMARMHETFNTICETMTIERAESEAWAG